MTQIVVVAKAHPVRDGTTIQSIAIDISGELPPLRLPLDMAEWDMAEWERYLDVQAAIVEQALFDALPGGTYTHLLVKMLERRTCLLRVPLGPRNE